MSKKIVLGVSGSIAAYKSIEITSQLKKKGYQVYPVVTKGGEKFVNVYSLEIISGNKVLLDFFTTINGHIPHLFLAENADLVCIYPATADIIAKIAGGIADELLTAIVLATTAQILICPAMDENMFLNSITQENIKKLEKRGMEIFQPQEGRLASGKFGKGRLPSPEKVIERIQYLSSEKKLKSKKVLITAGPTREYIDPVRYISNDSSGKMGYEIAKVAYFQGAQVTLISGPTAIEPPPVNVIWVKKAKEMEREVKKYFPQTDIFISVAAVSDWSFEKTLPEKIKKENKPLKLELIPSPDILKEISKTKKENQIIVGFSLETTPTHQKAIEKIKQKNLDFLVVNLPENIGKDTATVRIMDKDGEISFLKEITKEEIAIKLLDLIIEKMK